MSDIAPTPVIRLLGCGEADLQHCRLLFDDYHRFDLVARRAGMPAPETVRRGGKAKMPRASDVPPTQIQSILDGPGGADIPKLVAPYLVWRVKPYSEEFHIVGWAPHPAAVFRVMCKDWKAAIDYEVKLWTVEFNHLFKKVLFPLYALSSSWGRGVAGMEPPNLAVFDETVEDDDERARCKLEAGRRWFEAKLMVEEFKEHSGLNIHPDQFQRTIKEMPNIWEGKIRTLGVVNGELSPSMMPQFNINVDSVTFYFSAGGQVPQCQICGPLGKKCISACTPAFHGLPSIHGDKAVVMCGPKCIDALTIRYDPRSSEPLDVSAGYDTLVDLAPDLQGATFEKREPRSNLSLLKCMLRRRGVVAPFYGPRIRSLVGGIKYDAFFRHGALREEQRPRPSLYQPNGPTADDYMYPRSPPPAVIVLDHPAFQKTPTSSLQSLIGIGPYELSVATKDYNAERAIREDVWKYEIKRRSEKMITDFISMATQGALEDDESSLTLDDLDSWFPGTKATIALALCNVRFNSQITHILDVPSGNEICEAVRFMIGTLARRDGMHSESRAHGHAYAWYTGIYLARVPDTSLRDVSRRLNIDLALADRDGGAHESLWETCITGMHAFSAIDWEHMGVRATTNQGSTGGSSSDAIIGRFEWYVNIGGTEVKGNYNPALTRESYVKMRKSGRAFLDSMGWSVQWPKVPTVEEVAEVRSYIECHRSAVDAPTTVLDYVTVVAKQLCCFKSTRAYGIDVLTGFDSRGFCVSAYSAQLRARELAIMVDAMPDKDEPDDESEEGEGM